MNVTRYDPTEDEDTPLCRHTIDLCLDIIAGKKFVPRITERPSGLIGAMMKAMGMDGESRQERIGLLCTMIEHCFAIGCDDNHMLHQIMDEAHKAAHELDILAEVKEDEDDR